MAVENFLSTLLSDGRAKDLFEVIEIGQLPNACCPHSTTAVIDFDKAKIKIVASSNMHTIKSCDGLKILPQHERVDFIEFKGFKAFTQHQLSKYKRIEPLNQKIERQFEKYDLQGKIEDSLVLWEMIIRSNDFVWNNETRKAARSVEKRYIILKHCNNIDEYDNALNA